MGRFLCNYFTAHPNPEDPTHTHRPTHLPNSQRDTALGLAATKRNDISACLCGLISSLNEYSWTHEYSRGFFGTHYFKTASSWIFETFFWAHYHSQWIFMSSLVLYKPSIQNEKKSPKIEVSHISKFFSPKACSGSWSFRKCHVEPYSICILQDY